MGNGVIVSLNNAGGPIMTRRNLEKAYKNRGFQQQRTDVQAIIKNWPKKRVKATRTFIKKSTTTYEKGDMGTVIQVKTPQGWTADSKFYVAQVNWDKRETDWADILDLKGLDGELARKTSIY